MKRSLLALSCAALTCATMTSGAYASATAAPAAAASHAATTPKIDLAAEAARAKPIATTVCAACHGADGNSPIPANPKLAGQHPEYLFKQLKNFKAADGKQPERLSPVMNGMVAAFDEKQLHEFAAYFSLQTQKGEVAKNRETIEFGQKLYRGGDQAKGLPACAACHGPNGAGLPAQYPRIGGQYAEYTETQLKAFRDGARANDPNKMMRMIAIKMTDAEIKAVSDYIAGLR